jgi:hypothetical protein
MPNQEDQQEEEEEEDEEGRNVVWMCETVCVFCVLLLQTATLNVLLQTAQFQHLQSPRTEHPKQRFFFHLAQVPTTYMAFAICSLGSHTHG